MKARLKKKLIKLGCLGQGTTQRWLRLRAWADLHPKWDCSDRSVERGWGRIEKAYRSKK